MSTLFFNVWICCFLVEGTSMYAPIILFVYNRIEHTKKAIENLKRCELAEDSILFIYSDGAKVGDEKEVAMVREYVHQVSGFKEINIIERKKNHGVEESEILGITEILALYPTAIILEDDLIVAKNFLSYMNYALDKYQNEKKVFYISGYNLLRLKSKDLPDCMFMRMACTWGWATWSDRWKCFEFPPRGVENILFDKHKMKRYNLDNAYKSWGSILAEQYKANSYTWDTAWYVKVFNANGVILIPNVSLVINIGFDGSGVHCGRERNPINSFAEIDCNIMEWPDTVEEIQNIRKKICRLLKYQNLHQKYKDISYSVKKRLHIN